VNPAEQRRRRRLADDVVRTVGFMNSVLADARRAAVPIPEAVAVSIGAWRSWAERLDAWADRTP
jgi:hypothetical protein